MERWLIIPKDGGLSEQSYRSFAVRIPEVSMRLRQAEAVLEEKGVQVDLRVQMLADQRHMQYDRRIVDLMVGLIQLGLWDRCLRLDREPDKIIGVDSEVSCLRVISGETSFKDYVEELSPLKVDVGTRGSSGAPQYIAFEKTRSGYQRLTAPSTQLMTVLENIANLCGLGDIQTLNLSPMDADVLRTISQRFQLTINSFSDFDQQLVSHLRTLRSHLAIVGH